MKYDEMSHKRSEKDVVCVSTVAEAASRGTQFFWDFFFFFCSLKFPSVLSFLSIKRASALFWEISLFFCISWFSYTKIKSHCTFVSLLRSDNVFIYFFLFLYPWFMSEDIESWMIPLRENSG